MSNLLINNGFKIGEIEIRYYGIIIASAMLIGILLSQKLAKKKGVDPDDIIGLALLILPLSILGARIYYVAFSGMHYTFKEFVNIRSGGLAIYGGVIGGFIGIVIFCTLKKNFKLLIKICDVVVPALILGQALGRWGNFFNQEAYGYAVSNPKWQWFPFAVYIEAEGGYFLATFFYESMWNLIVFFILLITLTKSKQTGTTTAMYLILYGLGRIFIEGLRTDSLYVGATSIRVSQLLSGILIVIGFVILVYNFVKARSKK